MEKLLKTGGRKYDVDCLMIKSCLRTLTHINYNL